MWGRSKGEAVTDNNFSGMYSLMKAQTFEWIAENEDESRQNGTKRGHVMSIIYCVQRTVYP